MVYRTWTLRTLSLLSVSFLVSILNHNCFPTLESTINVVLSLCGGKKKRKKKVYTKPKKIGHKHKKRSKAILEYFNVDNTGKITKLKIECEKCPPATYMADHPDRHTCGKCGNMFYKLTKDGKRLPIPKQNKPAAAAKAEAPAAAGKGAAKGKKK